MNTDWIAIGIAGAIVLFIVGLLLKEKFDAAKINRLEQKSTDLLLEKQVHNMSDDELRADVAKRMGNGSDPKT